MVHVKDHQHFEFIRKWVLLFSVITWSNEYHGTCVSGVAACVVMKNLLGRCDFKGIFEEPPKIPLRLPT